MYIVRKAPGLLLSIGFLLLFLPACSPMVGQGQSGISANRPDLSAGQSVGQTFTSRHAGLAGIEIYLSPGSPPPNGKITLSISSIADRSSTITQASLDAKTVDRPGFYRIPFSPQSDSYRKDYFFQLEFEGSGKLHVGANHGGSYPEGSLYINGTPVDLQSTFQQIYDPFQLALGMFQQGVNWSWNLALSLWLFLTPGWALLRGLWSGWKGLQWGEKIGLAAGVSLALFPAVFLWARVLGIQAGEGLSWGIILLASIFLLWKNRLDLFQRPRKLHLPRWDQVPWTSIVYLLVALLIFGIRIWVIRVIDYPLWGDSYQHNMIAQLILDNRGLFDSWAPYVPYTSLTVQYGFSADTAALSWISALPMPLATTWTGQIINGLAILALYPMALRLSKYQPWAGIAAMVIGGLLMPMPMMYVNWGRYAQLCGQAILPAAIWLGWDAFSEAKLNKRKILLTALVIVGMLLSYYRMFFYFGAFFLGWLFAWGLPTWRLNFRAWGSFLIRGFVLAAVGLLLISPWLAHVKGSTLASGVETGLSLASPLEAVIQDYSNWRDISLYVPLALLFLSLAASIWAVFRKRWMVVNLSVWTALLAGIVAGTLINLPGANMMQSFAVLIFLYVPVSLASGSVIGNLAEIVNTFSSKLAKVVLPLGILVISVWGAYQFRNISQPEVYGYVTRPDMRAGAWIRQNVPQNARFLVEGYRIYNGDSAVGSDAGWWLPLLAGRENSLPPQYALRNEQASPADYGQKVVDLIAVLESNAPNTPRGLAAICRMGLTHIYIGQGQGLVGAHARQLFTRDQLLKSSAFHEIYHQDRVSIFSMDPQACPK